MAHSNHGETCPILPRLGNFYQKFILHYSDLVKPLTNLTKKDKKFEWTEGCQQALNNLKK